MHCIPIEGIKYTGTASLKAAVELYFKFVDRDDSPGCSLEPGPNVGKNVWPVEKPAPSSAWPKWDRASEDEVLALARVIARYVRFLAPEIIDAVVNDGEQQRERWADALRQRGIAADAYLWERSPCAFPGVRRYAGSQEIAVFRKKAKAEGNSIKDALCLDDNDYPKQIWSFTFTGKKFPKHGPVGYSLAHLADHKSHGNRFESDFEVVGDAGARKLFGLYTCLTNTAYVPSSMIKPTDFGPNMRNLLMRRAEHLYAAHCRLLPDWLKVRAASSVDWHLDAFEWAKPVGDATGIKAFLAYRNAEIERLIAARPSTGGSV